MTKCAKLDLFNSIALKVEGRTHKIIGCVAFLIYIPHIKHERCLKYIVSVIMSEITRGSLAKKKIMFLHSKNKASRKGYKGEC